MKAEELTEMNHLMELGHRHTALLFSKFVLEATENESLLWYAQRLARIIGIKPNEALVAIREAASIMTYDG